MKSAEGKQKFQTQKSELDSFEAIVKNIRHKQVAIELYLDRYMPSKVLSLIYDSFKAGDIFTENAPPESRYYVH